MKCARNSVGNEIDPEYFKLGVRRVKTHASQSNFFANTPRVEVR
jgi:DNA modification methylase